MHCMAAWNSDGSNCRLRPGEGAVESHAAAWGDDTDERLALSGNSGSESMQAVFQFVRKHLCLPNVIVSSLETCRLLNGIYIFNKC